MGFLRAGCVDEKGMRDTEKEAIYSLAKLDISKLLQVSPAVVRSEEPPEPAVEKEPVVPGRQEPAVERQVERARGRGSKAGARPHLDALGILDRRRVVVVGRAVDETQDQHTIARPRRETGPGVRGRPR